MSPNNRLMTGFNQNLLATLMDKQIKRNDEEKLELITMTNDYMTIAIIRLTFPNGTTEWM